VSPSPLDRSAAEARAKYPDPKNGLAHTLAVFADEPDESFVVVATGNIYGPGIRTGLTWGELRRVAAEVGGAA
jgi:hypothetical protein